MKPFALFSLMAAIASAAFAQADDRSDIDLLYAKLGRAMMAKSVAGVVALESPDFYSKVQGRILDKRQSEAETKKQFAAMRTVRKYNQKLLSVEVKGTRAVVLSSYVLEGTAADAKNIQTLSFSGKFKTTLVKSAAGWQFQAIEDVPPIPKGPPK
jgi:ketosteroid isomerase-like protein